MELTCGTCRYSFWNNETLSCLLTGKFDSEIGAFTNFRSCERERVFTFSCGPTARHWKPIEGNGE